MDDACTSNPCHADAICDTSPINGSYTCSCASGYKGVDCSEDINECEQGKFHNASFLPKNYKLKPCTETCSLYLHKCLLYIRVVIITGIHKILNIFTWKVAT